MKKTTVTMTVSLFLVVLFLAAGCSFPAKGNGEAEAQARASLVDAEGYTQVEVLAVLEGDPLQDPAGVAVTAQGEILVSDRARHQIYRFSPDGKLVGQIGSLGAEPGQFNQPGALSLDGKGNIYVADIGNNRVQVLDPRAGFLDRWGAGRNFPPSSAWRMALTSPWLVWPPTGRGTFTWPSRVPTTTFRKTNSASTAPKGSWS